MHTKLSYGALLKSFVIATTLTLTGFSSSAQCAWTTVLSDGFEYSQATTSPDFIPGVNYGVAHPASYAAHTGSQSVYLNFIDSNSVSPPGVHAGTLFYRKTITVCPNIPYRVSIWFCTTFPGLQCNIKAVLKDGNGAVLNAVNSFPCPYAPAFGQYTSGAVTPTTSTMVLDLYTNVGGGGGNDLGIDDLLIEQCFTSPGIKTQTNLCSNSPTLNLYGLFPGTRPTYGSWTGPSPLNGAYLGTYTPSVNVQGQYLYTYNFQNNSSCPLIKDTVNVVMPQTPTLSVNQGTICAGQQTATLIASGAGNYTWTPTTGLNSTSSATVLGNPSSTTSYTVIGANGLCRDTATTSITVRSIPAMSVNSATLCSGASATLTANGASSYTWNPNSFLSSIMGASVVATPSASIIYTVTGATSSCTAAVNATVLVIPSPSISAVSASICLGSGATLSASGASSYSWSPAAGLSTNTGSLVTASPSISTTYTVIGVTGICSDTTTSNVTVDPLPALTITSATLCAGASANLVAAGASTYTWSPLTGLSAVSGASATATPSASASYTVGGTLGLCKSTIQTTVLVNPLPVVVIKAGSSLINTPGEGTTISVTGGSSYEWANGATTASIVVVPLQTTNYCVNVRSKEGCEQRGCILIEVTPESTLYIPNAFSPNDDGTNDLFFTPGTNIVTYHLLIYDRWGGLVFESHDPQTAWDGTFRGMPVKQDIYNYVLRAEGIDHVVYQKSGSITIIK